jgi:hypothetical protein
LKVNLPEGDSFKFICQMVADRFKEVDSVLLISGRDIEDHIFTPNGKELAVQMYTDETMHNYDCVIIERDTFLEVLYV